MTYQINKLTTKSWNEVHDDVVRTVRNGMVALGITDNPQLGPGSDEEIWARVVANETQPLYVNAQIMADEQMPDTASINDPSPPVGAGLTRLMKIKGLAPRGAVPSSGFMTLASSASTNITGRDGGVPGSGQQLVDSAGHRFEVTTSGTYANGAPFPIIAIDGGDQTNHEAGDLLQWYGTPPFAANPRQVVATGGLTGGKNEEDNENARARLIDREQNPPGSGNWSQFAGWAEESTALVQKAFVYPAVNGPSTVHVAVTSSGASRAVDATVLANIVFPYVIGKVFGGTEVVVTTVTEQDVDVAVGLTLPSSPTAAPAGPGGGWVDGTPWPAISGTANTYANVTAVASSLQFTVNAPTAPIDNVSHICMWDGSVVNSDGTLGAIVRAKVISHSGSSGAYVITIDTPFPNVTSSGGTGTLIFPDATNMNTYARAFADAMTNMGPGEKTSNTSVLSRGFRHPTPQSAWPSSLNATQLKKVEDTGDEVLDTAWYYRSTTTPTVPGSVSNPPSQLVLRRLGFYPN